MTDILKLAREAGASPYTNRHLPGLTYNTFSPETLQRFADLIRADAIPPGYVVVPIDLLASACSAIDKLRYAPVTLAKLREYTLLQAAKEQQK